MSVELQLSAIRDLSPALAAASVDHWLIGGWAVDFACGRVSRAHKDVDLLIWRDDANAAASALAAAGFTQVETDHPDEKIEFERQAVDVELIFIVRTPAGELVTPGRWIDWPWPPDTLGGPMGRVGSVSCRTISFDAQIESKRGYEAYQGDPPRRHDLRDLELLEPLAGRHGTAQGGPVAARAKIVPCSDPHVCSPWARWCSSGCSTGSRSTATSTRRPCCRGGRRR